MKQRIANIVLLVRDYDEAIAFYTHKMDFSLVEDTDLGGGVRWVRVMPPGAAETSLVLAKADTPEEQAQVGCQAGGRVLMILFTDDFRRDYEAMHGKGVVFHEEPRDEVYGTVAVFGDLYGNKWDLLEPKG
jgi:catechol 2,3-dioxygenase-like lactoylglutathione lyase family enzyme